MKIKKVVLTHSSENADKINLAKDYGLKAFSPAPDRNFEEGYFLPVPDN